MEPPRISVNSVLAAVGVVAIDCMLVRSARSRPDLLTGELELLAYGSLPMANLLAIGLVLLFHGRGRSRPFLRGFVAWGGMALFAYFGCACWSPRSIGVYLESIFDALGERSGLMDLPAWAIVEQVGFPVLASSPQVLVALAGGWMTSRFGGGSRAATDEGTAYRRLGLRTLLVLLALVAAPALAVEAWLRWKVDPIIARLGVGTMATLDLHGESHGFGVKLPDGTWFVVPDGTRVRVDEDGQEPRLGPMRTAAGMGPVCDQRTVRVTLLEGERAGLETWFWRGYLKSIR